MLPQKTQLYQHYADIEENLTTIFFWQLGFAHDNYHRSDSNQGSDHIVNFFKFLVSQVKTWKSKKCIQVRIFFFHVNQYLDTKHI